MAGEVYCAPRCTTMLYAFSQQPMRRLWYHVHLPLEPSMNSTIPSHIVPNPDSNPIHTIHAG